MRGQTLQELYDAEITPLQIKPSYRTFQHWHMTGTKFAALAGGGTVYILVLVAGLGLRTSLASMPGDLTCHLGNALRHPDPGKDIRNACFLDLPQSRYHDWTHHH